MGRRLLLPIAVLFLAGVVSLGPGCGSDDGTSDGGNDSPPASETPTPTPCQGLGDLCFFDSQCCEPGICAGANPQAFQPGTCLAPPAA